MIATTALERISRGTEGGLEWAQKEARLALEGMADPMTVDSGKPIPDRRWGAKPSKLSIRLRAIGVRQSIDVETAEFSPRKITCAISYIQRTIGLRFTVRHLADSDPDTYRIWRTE